MRRVDPPGLPFPELQEFFEAFTEGPRANVTTTRLDPLTVLLVDSRPDFLAAASSWIERHHAMCLVGTAKDGVEAVAAVARLAPEVVLIDAFMPRMDGFRATREIKQRAGAPFIVILSVSDGRTMEREARAAGADAFLTKTEFASGLDPLMQRVPRRAPAANGLC